jgi:hypothetical protein
MIKKYQCWCCEEEASPSFIKAFGTNREIRLCGSCVGTIAAIECRLNEITRRGELSSDFTANGPDVPDCEKDS